MLQVFHVYRVLSSANGQALIEEINVSLGKGVREIIINCRGVSFMDSMGLNCLVRIKHRVSEAGGQLALCSLCGQAKMILELANLDEIFECYDSLDSFCNESSCQMPPKAEQASLR